MEFRVDKAKHHAEIMDSLMGMRRDGEHCDFTIKVKKKKLRAHRNILCAGSEYFRAMLRHDTVENQRSEVDMRNVDFDCVKECIDFLYTAEFTIPSGKIEEFLHVSHMLQLSKINSEVHCYLAKGLKLSNFFFTRRIAHLFRFTILDSICEQFEKKNILNISSQIEFKQEEKSYLSYLLRSVKQFLTEEEKLVVVMNWAGESKEKKSDLLELLNLVCLKKVGKKFFDKIIEKNSLVSEDQELLVIFYQAYKEAAQYEETMSSHDLILFNRDKDCLQTCRLLDLDITNVFRLDSVLAAKFRQFGYFSSIVMDSYVYILCQNKSVYRLNVKIAGSGWEKLNDMVERHGYYPPVATALKSLYVVGYGWENPSNCIEQCNPSSGVWRKLPNKLKAICDPAVVSFNYIIFCIGGHTGGLVVADSDSFCSFNSRTSRWANLPSLQKPKRLCGAAAVDHKILVFGGRRKSKILNEMECFNLVTSQWSALSSMVNCGSSLVAHLFHSTLYVAERNKPSTDLMMYDISKNNWDEAAIFDKDTICGVQKFTLFDFVKT